MAFVAELWLLKQIMILLRSEWPLRSWEGTPRASLGPRDPGSPGAPPGLDKVVDLSKTRPRVYGVEHRYKPRFRGLPAQNLAANRVFLRFPAANFLHRKALDRPVPEPAPDTTEFGREQSE